MKIWSDELLCHWKPKLGQIDTPKSISYLSNLISFMIDYKNIHKSPCSFFLSLELYFLYIEV